MAIHIFLRSDYTSPLWTTEWFSLGSPPYEASHNILNCQSPTLGLLLRTTGSFMDFWESVPSFQIKYHFLCVSLPFLVYFC